MLELAYLGELNRKCLNKIMEIFMPFDVYLGRALVMAWSRSWNST